MGAKDRAAKAAASAASIAVATSGLSSGCDNGAVDPLPPPLACDSTTGEWTLNAEAAVVSEDTVGVTVRYLGHWEWSIDSVQMNSGGTITDAVLPQDDSSGYGTTMTLRVAFDSGSTSATFTVYAKAYDYQTTCDIVRQFTVTAAGTIASSAQLRLDGLPLPSRQTVMILLVAQEGNTATLEARTGYAGAKTVKWYVSDGSLATDTNGRAAWTLPEARGTYQAQVVADFGDYGVAFDALSVEVL